MSSKVQFEVYCGKLCTEPLGEDRESLGVMAREEGALTLSGGSVELRELRGRGLTALGLGHPGKEV